MANGKTATARKPRETAGIGDNAFNVAAAKAEFLKMGADYNDATEAEHTAKGKRGALICNSMIAFGALCFNGAVAADKVERWFLDWRYGEGKVAKAELKDSALQSRFSAIYDATTARGEDFINSMKSAVGTVAAMRKAREGLKGKAKAALPEARQPDLALYELALSAKATKRPGDAKGTRSGPALDLQDAAAVKAVITKPPATKKPKAGAAIAAGAMTLEVVLDSVIAGITALVDDKSLGTPKDWKSQLYKLQTEFRIYRDELAAEEEESEEEESEE